MKRAFLLILLIPLGIVSFGQNLYDNEIVGSIEITFTQSNWDQILDTYYANGNDERLIATVVINGESFDSVGVKYKGNSTYNPNNVKNPFNIKLDEFIKQDYQGYTTLKLSTGDKDPSFVREVLGYEIARKYMDAPQANYTKIYINGNYHGLYDNVESVNGDFQEKYLYANRDETRVKCNPANVMNGGSSLEYLGANESSYYNYYELDSDSGWLDLINLCNIVDNAPSLIESYLDIDRAIWMLAYNNVLVNLDSYTGPFKQNYYLIMAKNNNMTPVIWDLNQNFGSFSMINQGPGTNNLGEMSLTLRENDASWPLLKLILDDPTYKRMYLAHCKTIFEENIENNLYYSRAQELQSSFASDLQNDNNAIFSYSQAQTNLTTSVSSGGGPNGSIIGIKALFDARTTYLNITSEFQASAPSISNINYPESVPANSSFDILANVSNATNVILGFREFAGDRFSKIAMFDDGLHNDGAAGDGQYGFSISANASDIQFYIYAENSDAGIFSPQRAEHEYYSIATSYDVVLNEIQARNNITRADQNGEFDDWIELYNNSANTIDLSSYYLSDKGSQLDKWAFPSGTSIAPDEYLIVWADADTFQAGLHANFKLSGGGESVYLSDGTNLFDKIKYVYFYPDTAYGRLPNGTGSLSLLKPTFKANNNPGVRIKEIPSEHSFLLYPNPSSTKIHVDSEEQGLIRVYDILGNQVMQSQNRSLDISNLLPGIYFVNLNNNAQKLIVK